MLLEEQDFSKDDAQEDASKVASRGEEPGTENARREVQATPLRNILEIFRAAAAPKEKSNSPVYPSLTIEESSIGPPHASDDAQLDTASETPRNSKEQDNKDLPRTTYKEFLGLIDKVKPSFSDDDQLFNDFERLLAKKLNPNGIADSARKEMLEKAHETRLDSLNAFNDNKHFSTKQKEEVYAQASRLLSEGGKDGAILVDQLITGVAHLETRQSTATCTATGLVDLLSVTNPQLVFKDVADSFLKGYVTDRTDSKTIIDPASIKADAEESKTGGSSELTSRSRGNIFGKSEPRPWAYRLAELAIANRHWGQATKDAKGKALAPGESLSYIHRNGSDQLVKTDKRGETVEERDLRGNIVNYPGLPFGAMAETYRRMTGESQAEVKSRFLISDSAQEFEKKNAVTTIISTQEDFIRELNQDPNKARLLYVSLNPKTSEIGKAFSSLPATERTMVKGNSSVVAHIVTLRDFKPDIIDPNDPDSKRGLAVTAPYFSPYNLSMSVEKLYASMDMKPPISKRPSQ